MSAAWLLACVPPSVGRAMGYVSLSLFVVSCVCVCVCDAWAARACRVLSCGVWCVASMLGDAGVAVT